MSGGQDTTAREHTATPVGRLHFLGLDGLRGIAVVMVLLFHQGYGWAQGGFLGVSMFFTLSGFLITNLLLAEHSSTGRIAVGAFLARRARRLAPLAVTVALLIAVAWLILEGNTASPSIGPDLIASLAKVSNWWFIVDRQSYGDLFAAPSPYLHYWSLAVEEQLYLLWPLALIAILRLRSQGSRVVAAVALTLVCASFTFVHDSFDVIYYGTHVRAAELLAGGVLALIVAGRTDVLSSRRDGRSKTLTSVSWLVLAALVAAVAVFGQTSAVWRDGGLAAVGALSAVLVAGVIVPGSLRTVMSHPVLRWIGRWSYGIYLVHWPVFVMLTAERTGLPDVAVFPVRLVVTIAIALLLGRLVEQPIRTKRVLPRPRYATLGYASVTLIGLCAATAVTITVDDPSDGVVASGPQIFVGGDDGDVSSVATSPAPPPPRRVFVVGSTSMAMVELEDRKDLAMSFSDDRIPGCPIVDAIEVVGEQTVGDLTRCPSPSSWADAFHESGADAVLITVGRPDLGRMRTPDGILQRRIATRGQLLDSLRNAVRDLRDSNVPILLAPEPDVRGSDRDKIEELLDVVALTDPWVRADAAHADDDRADWVRTNLDDLLQTETTAKRLMVLGDSTGASLSRLIFEETDGQQETVGLAQEGCPLIPVDGIRWWDQVEFDLDTCPSIDDIRSYAETFKPSAVLLSSSLMEQAEFRVGDGEWFDPLSDEYVLLHDAYMEELQSALAESSTTPVIWVLDSPPIGTGSFGDSPMAWPERIDAWNAQIDRWTATWLNVRRLPWSSAVQMIDDAEGPIRPDGVHIDEPYLRRLVEELVIPALADDSGVRREMRRAGCIVPGGGHLDLSRCRR